METIIVVWKDGTYKEVDKNSAWEFENDDNWLVSFPAKLNEVKSGKHKNNQLFESLKETDIVMIELPSTERATIKQLCIVFNLRLIPSDEKHNFDWLDFDGLVLYTNIRLHKSLLNKPIGNCMAITEIVNLEQIEQTARNNDMWKADKYLLSDAELEAKRNLANEFMAQ